MLNKVEKMGTNVSVDFPKINRLFLLAFCGYVLIWYLQIGERVPALGAVRFEFIYAAILTVIAIFLTPKIDANCPLTPLIVFYFIAILIQIPFSYDFDTSWTVFVDRIIKFAFMAFFIVSFVRSPTDLKFFLAAFLLACMKMGQEGMVGRITGSLIWENQGVMRLHGATPMYMHPNSFSGMAIGTLPFVYYLWPICNKYVKLGLLLIGIFSINIIIFSASRTSYVGLLFLLLFIIYFSENKKKLIMWLGVLFVLGIPLVPNDYVSRFDSIFSEQEKEGHSIDARKQILSDAWQIFKEHPFGIGVSAFPKVRMQRFDRSQDTHNLYFEVATNLGIQGIVIFFLLISKMMFSLNTIRRSARGCMENVPPAFFEGTTIPGDMQLIECVALATMSFVFTRLSLGLFGMDLYEIYWWFAIGLTFSLYSMLKRIQKNISYITAP
jgi:putative inorganic carbon (hco3(-)) transporter